MVKDKWFASLAGNEADKYVLDSYVGSGMLGYVYQGHPKDMPEWKVAIKLTPGSPKAGWENEINKASKLRGITGVVAFHGLGEARIKAKGRTEVFLYTVWDFIPPGRNLKQYLKKTDTCPTSFLLAILEQILRVLHACQMRGVKRHGDLHAGNILIGDKDEADLDSSLNIREPIYVSDFGYGSTGGDKVPKDDYIGLASIADAIIEKTEWDKATTTDRQLIKGIRELMQKLLREQSESERRPPKEILKAIIDLDQRVRASGGLYPSSNVAGANMIERINIERGMSVGQFQITEMLGDDWERWRKLFVSAVPAKSRILEPDTATVVTGPRGCGKTMLFRRLSERLMVECGPVDDAQSVPNFVGLYVNANDVAAAFSSFQKGANRETDGRLICYANLSILSDILAVQSARSAKFKDKPTQELLETVRTWLVEEDEPHALIIGENPLEHYRLLLERIKWNFSKVNTSPQFPAYEDFSQLTWLPRLISMVRRFCPWINSKAVYIFIDDYTTPRISEPMQKVLNRLLFQRSSEFVCKMATESATTFISVDSSGKILQDGDDYQLVDMGEESLFMPDSERAWFLNEIFQRRLSLDLRIPEQGHTLEGLLEHLEVKKLEFARMLRNQTDSKEPSATSVVPTGSQRRGRTRAKALYHGSEVFADLWSGDTRTMIQLVQELVDAATPANAETQVPIESEIQDRVFRRRGGQWLESQRRNQPTDREAFDKGLNAYRADNPKFELTGGSYGGHLKAIVEAFVKSARQLLLSPMYRIKSGNNIREVPRMAFRIEITDEFRIEGLASEIYKDLIRYGMFMRDARGKSVRGAFVPRLYLRRLLLPYATLALSKRDSVSMNCAWFTKLLLTPDKFSTEFTRYIEAPAPQASTQISLFSLGGKGKSWSGYTPNPLYNDIDLEDTDLEETDELS
ncbi:MAG: hypothetical protein LC803_09645 [Acidobacteria bacterium]|nr:hypothetical protein [Acidobacteriota bacterium]